MSRRRLLILDFVDQVIEIWDVVSYRTFLSAASNCIGRDALGLSFGRSCSTLQRKRLNGR